MKQKLITQEDLDNLNRRSTVGANDFVFFNELQNMLDSLPDVDSEPVAWKYQEWLSADYEWEQGCYSKQFTVSLIKPSKHKNLIPLFTTPQPAPDTVPRAEYNKLLENYKDAVQEIEDWAQYASAFFQNKHNLSGTLENHRKIISEAQKGE